jgi:hypothetical protein
VDPVGVAETGGLENVGPDGALDRAEIVPAVAATGVLIGDAPDEPFVAHDVAAPRTAATAAHLHMLVERRTAQKVSLGCIPCSWVSATPHLPAPLIGHYPTLAWVMVAPHDLSASGGRASLREAVNL